MWVISDYLDEFDHLTVFHHWNDDRHGESSWIIPKCPNISGSPKWFWENMGK
jgi:hypothetical protein